MKNTVVTDELASSGEASSSGSTVSQMARLSDSAGDRLRAAIPYKCGKPYSELIVKGN